MTQSIKEAYEEIPYPSYVHPQTHPDRLATMAKFFGLNPTPVEKCRMLELGCADGRGLTAFAYDLRDSEFVGIDIAANHIEQGNQIISELGLENIKLLEMDLMKLDESFGKFDYIVAHGFFAWVPDFVREKVMDVCKKNLAENGVAYISFNAYPGCHIRQMIRGMMRYHTKDITGNIERANQAASLVKFLAEIKDTHNAYRYTLQTELKHYEKADIRNILFDDLGEINRPFYFHEFISFAEKFGLQFLSEVNYFEMQDDNLPENTRAMLSQIRGDIVRYIQYLDFMEGKRFHITLLCHDHHKINRDVSPEIMKEFFLTSNAQTESTEPDITGDGVETFYNERGARITTNNPLAKSSLHLMVKALPKYIQFDELLDECRTLINSQASKEDDADTLCKILFEIFSTGLVSIRTHQPKLATVVSEKPFANPLASIQAKQLSIIPNLLCENIRVDDEFTLKLLEFLDGTRDFYALRNEMKTWLESNDSNESIELKEKEKLLSTLDDAIEQNLQLMARKGLLIE